MSEWESLDFLYMPSRDVAADLEHFSSALRAEVVFAIEAFGTRVAMISLSPSEPALLLAGHLHGERTILVYRVADLEQTIETLEARGATGERFSIPHGPAWAYRTPGGHHVAAYQLTRPERAESLRGRRDF